MDGGWGDGEGGCARVCARVRACVRACARAPVRASLSVPPTHPDFVLYKYFDY